VAAAAAQLFVVVAGDPEAVTAAGPLFDVIGQRTFVVSETPRAANLVKLTGNFLICSVIESVGEAMALVSKAGVDKKRYLEILTSTLFDAPVYKTYGGLIADEQFEPAGFAAPLGHKDIRLVLEAAEGLQVPLPVASLLRDRLLTLLANGGEHLDWSAVGALAAWEAGTATLPGG
jgi:3-hydroxyisobutyrate dehydrogenase-like beta-hydroxyacid dehydrogenase